VPDDSRARRSPSPAHHRWFLGDNGATAGAVEAIGRRRAGFR
jgi:hypothetical protein